MYVAGFHRGKFDICLKAAGDLEKSNLDLHEKKMDQQNTPREALVLYVLDAKSSSQQAPDLEVNKTDSAFTGSKCSMLTMKKKGHSFCLSVHI